MRMKSQKYLKILPLFIICLMFQRFVIAGEQENHQKSSIGTIDTTKLTQSIAKVDSSLAKKEVTKREEKNILDILNGVVKENKIISWQLNRTTFDLDLVEGIDSTLNTPHLILPKQKRLESLTFLGNMGSPIQSDHFFSRNHNYSFLFSRNYIDYTPTVQKQYHLRRPLTIINYSMGGKTSESEQILRVLHSQNVNKYLNFGLTYDFYGTKGIYMDQETKNNFFSLFSSYYRNRFSFQGTAYFNRIRNKENGGLEPKKGNSNPDFFIQDTTVENKLIPFKLHGSSSEIRQKGASMILGFSVINRWIKSTDSSGNETRTRKPIFTVKALFDVNKNTRKYIDTTTNIYKNYYISKGNTRDSVMLMTYESTLMGEIEQIAKFPGLPGLRFWISNIRGNYYYYKPGDFIYNRNNDRIEANLIGVGTYSYSPYLSYSGSLRIYISGYRAADKELFGQMIISPWKSLELPYVRGKIEISDKEPDIFLKNYFSNNFKWDNNFSKEKWFALSGSIGAEKWRFEAGYNLVRINNYVYFDTTGVPSQTSGVTITSAFVQKEFKLGIMHFNNRIVWQANTNNIALSLPTFSLFSSLFFQYELVKNVLVGQIGASVFYRTKFYASAYSPATGQFYNQKEKQIGEYPVVDAFVNFKWKRAVLFFKLDHVNQGIPNNEYFSALHYPLNRMIFKLGVSWVFYD